MEENKTQDPAEVFEVVKRNLEAVERGVAAIRRNSWEYFNEINNQHRLKAEETFRRWEEECEPLFKNELASNWYKSLLKHAGHNIMCVNHPRQGKVTVTCYDCKEDIVHADKPDEGAH